MTTAAALIDRYESIVRSALGADAEFVKSVGDEVMLAFGEIELALDSAHAIFERCVATSGFPLPRGGAFHGLAVARGADYLGGSVNTAARIAAQARSGQFLVGDTVADIASERGFEVTRLGDFMLRNLIESVSINEVHLVASTRYVIDPVCRIARRRSRRHRSALRGHGLLAVFAHMCRAIPRSTADVHALIEDTGDREQPCQDLEQQEHEHETSSATLIRRTSGPLLRRSRSARSASARCKSVMVAARRSST